MAETGADNTIIRQIRNKETDGVNELIKSFSPNVINFLRCYFQDRWVLEREEEQFWRSIIPKIHGSRGVIDLNVFIYKELYNHIKGIVEIWEYNGPMEISLPDEGEYISELQEKMTDVFGKKIILNSETVDNLKRIIDDLEPIERYIIIFGKILKLPERDIEEIMDISRVNMAKHVINAYNSMSKTLIGMGLIEKEDGIKLVRSQDEKSYGELWKRLVESSGSVLENIDRVGIKAANIVSDLLDAHHPVTSSQSIREKILKWAKYDYFVPESEKGVTAEPEMSKKSAGCINAVIILILAILVVILW